MVNEEILQTDATQIEKIRQQIFTMANSYAGNDYGHIAQMLHIVCGNMIAVRHKMRVESAREPISAFEKQNGEHSFMIKLIEKEKPKGVWVGDMKNGDVAIIVNCVINCYVGRIVQRHGNALITIGASLTWSFTHYLPENFRVRLLEKGETLIVT